MKDNLIYYTYRSVKAFLSILPQSFKIKLSDLIAKIFYSVDKKHRTIVFRNLEFFMPEVAEKHESIAKNMYTMFARYLVDMIEENNRTQSDLNRIIVEKNRDAVSDLLAKNESFIFMTGHFGYWELIAQFLSANYRQITAIGKRFGDSKKLTKALFEQREKMGIEILLKRGAMRGFIRSIRNNNIVGLLPDQSTGEGVMVTFFGKELRWIDTSARLSKQYNIPIVPAFIVSSDLKSFELHYFDPIYPDNTLEKEEDINRLSQYEAASLEKIIREYPDHYFWLHKRAKREYPEVYQ